MRSNGTTIFEIDPHDRFVQRLLGGDDFVLADIQREIGSALRARLLRKYAGLLAPDRVEHVLNIALGRLWEHRDRFDKNKGTLQGWLGRIAENAARDLLRSGWCREMLRECSLEEPSVLVCVEDFVEERGDGKPDNSEIHDERLRVLRQALDRLSERRRRIVLEITLTASELAEELGICSVTVRRHRQEALQSLRTALERHEREDRPRKNSAKQIRLNSERGAV